MSRFLAYTSPARGHLYPITPTLLELAHRGHDVHLRTLSSEVDALTGSGLHAAAIDPAIEAIELTDWQSADPIEGITQIFGAFAERAGHEIADLRRAIDDVQPDCLVIDITTPGAAAVAEASGLPWARWIPFLAHASFDPAPSTSIDFIPYSLLPSGLDVVNDARAAVGLPPLASPDEGWRAAVELYLTAEPFEPPGLRYPESFRLVGPGVWEPASAPMAWLDEVEDPLVLVTASSEKQGDDGLISTAIEGLGGSDLAVAVSTAAHQPGSFAAPGNVRVERWLPHLPILQRAAAVVCHGGMGITQKALAAGVPVCVVPFGRDQFEVAKLVGTSRCGTVVMPDQLDPTHLASAVREAMTMREGAARVAEGFRKAGGAVSAADAVEALVGASVRIP
jgi:UDP:flavonoid glycosyltransferase YjiC (YdhE family)